MKILKNKKFLLGALLAFILFIFLIGFISIINNKPQSEQAKGKEGLSYYKKELENYPEFKDLIKILTTNDTILQKEAINYLNAEILKTGSKKIEIEAELVKKINPLVRSITIDNLKSDSVYASEFKNEIERLKYLNIDFNDKNNLRLAGEHILSVADSLSKINPPKNYYEFHKAEVIILGTMGQALIELSQTNDSERAISLLFILNNLADLQEKIVNKI